MNKISFWLSITLKSLLFAFILTILVGYLFGFRASLVIGGSSEPNIHYQSLVIDYKCSLEDLKVGDYITFKSGSILTTHMIVAIAGKGDFENFDKTFKKGEKIQFFNRGVKFERVILHNCQIVTMATNYSNFEEYTQKTKDNPNFIATEGSGSGIECVNYENVVGRVEHSLTYMGKFLIFVRNNFLQIVVYGIILYAGYILFKQEFDYSKLF